MIYVNRAGDPKFPDPAGNITAYSSMVKQEETAARKR